ncbi:hypothetical protein BD779DRAFT_1671432 [Infundibulicybe gibba]|nr:hypothetical protein BD779DRAFT_1671432 [Infundibulicybe gibba]
MTLITDFCDKWAVSLTTQQLHISVYSRFPLMDLALQHTMLCGALSQKFPALLSFRLTYEVEWERSAVDEAWRVSVPTWHREEVVALFKTGDPCVVDYDGHLQRLSTQRDLSN